MGRFSVALVHHPVLHKDGSTITSAITNTDLHDITRTCTAYGIARFYIVTPVALQQDLARRLIHHWTVGTGARKNPDRAHAFSCMAVATSIEEARAEEARLSGVDVELWATSARCLPSSVSIQAARERVAHTPAALMLLGTAFGLADSVVQSCSVLVAPIPGRLKPDGSRYNHLSVRAAAAIMLDRLLADDR